MNTLLGFTRLVKPPQKVPPRRRASSWIRSESLEARRRRTAAWRKVQQAAIGAARARTARAGSWLQPVPAEVPEHAPPRIPADREGVRLVGPAILGAYLEARGERASSTT
jgi:hypothetical protein